MFPTTVGAYRISGLVGTGSSAIVYRAQHERHGVVALKVRNALIAPPGAARADNTRSPSRESTALRALDHPGIARFLDEGLIESPLGHQTYVAMEFIDGVPFRDAVHALDRPARLRLLAAVCDIVDYAHRHGVVHRDLKPENIVVRPDGQPVILDFGLARFLEPDVRRSSVATGIGYLVGTIRYMGPEQAQAHADRIGPRSDIYSLGVLGYEMLAGELPYRISSTNIPGAILTIATVPARPIRDLDPTFSGAVEAILARALEKRIAWRYPTAHLMATDLRRAAAGRRLSPFTPRRIRRQQRDAWNRALHRTAKHPALPWAAGAAALAGAFALALLPPRVRSHDKPAPSTVQGLYELLQTAETQRGEADRTPGRFSAAFSPKTIRGTLALYDQALQIEHRIATHPTHDAEVRFIHWRRAELYYFLGTILQAPEPLQESLVEFEAARSIPWTLPDSLAAKNAPPIVRIILHEPAHVYASGPAIAAGALAAYRDPVTNRRRSFSANLETLRTFDQWAPYQLGRERFQAEDRAHSLRALGSDSVELGVLTDSLPLLDEGIRLLRCVDASAFGANPRASLLHALGAAWRARAELSGSHADLDSARAWLLAALPLRTAGGEVRRTEMELARCAVTAARLGRDPSQTAAGHRDARNHLLAALASLEYGPDLVAEAEIWMLLADLRLDAARRPVATRLASTAGGAPPTMSDLLPAQILLDGAWALLPPDRYPVKHAGLLVQQAALEQALAVAGGGAEHASRATVLLEAAARMIPPAESPRLHRFIRQGGS